jgi:hypothetical protein
MTKREKWAVSLAVSGISYLRSVVVFVSIIAFVDGDWLVLLASWLIYAITSWALTKTLDYPSDETLQELSELLDAMLEQREKPLSEKKPDGMSDAEYVAWLEAHRKLSWERIEELKQELREEKDDE